MRLTGPTHHKFLDPLVLSRINNLQLVAKSVVQGFLAGLHRSPFHGFSLDFAEYRPYSPGDDIGSVDWKVYGRSDRFYVKKYGGDTNTQVQLLLDGSKSMGFQSHALSKLDYARFLAASLAYFSTRQKDATGLVVFDTSIRQHLPARTSGRHLPALLHQLEQMTPRGQTDLASVLEDFSRLIPKRNLVILISDFYQDIERLTRALRFFHHRGNDTILFHLLDPEELGLPYEKSYTLTDMENLEELPYVPEESRSRYLGLLQEHVEALRRECLGVSMDYQLLNTNQPLDQALYRYLSVRARKY